MTDQTWVPVLNESGLQEGTVSRVFPKGVSIIMIRRGEEIFALRNMCAHMGCTLAAGRLEGYTLTCPCHEWHYDIRTGEFIDAREISIQNYEWKSVDGVIHIKIEE